MDEIESNKKSILAGERANDIFDACYQLGIKYKNVNDWPNAIYWWFEAYDRCPDRVESLYEIVKHYREIGKKRSAQLVLDKAIKIQTKTTSVTNLLLFEQSILSYYSGVPIDHYKYLDLIGSKYEKNTVLRNYTFYAKKLKDYCSQDIDFSDKKEIVVRDVLDVFTSSSPCIIPHNEGYMLNIRYVNYTIYPNGSYGFHTTDRKLATLNLLHWLNKDFKPIRSHWFDKIENTNVYYMGVEDIRVFSHCEELLFTGTIEDPSTGRIVIGNGKYDHTSNCLYPSVFNSPNNRSCEKNWCYFHNSDGELRIIYEWSPLSIYMIEDVHNIKHVQSNTNVPAFFSDIRGSSNGTLVNDEIWFACHLVVECSTPRTYYHCIVILDSKTMEYKRHSILFKFHGDIIEYCLGFIVEPDRFIFSYSRMDCTSAVMVLDREKVTHVLFPPAV